MLKLKLILIALVAFCAFSHAQEKQAVSLESLYAEYECEGIHGFRIRLIPTEMRGRIFLAPVLRTLSLKVKSISTTLGRVSMPPPISPTKGQATDR